MAFKEYKGLDLVATGNEVLAFASEVVESVRSKFGVNLNMEVNVI